MDLSKFLIAGNGICYHIMGQLVPMTDLISAAVHPTRGSRQAGLLPFDPASFINGPIGM
jgi:hypothetical protein